jgi:hypothetical protein
MIACIDLFNIQLIAKVVVWPSSCVVITEPVAASVAWSSVMLVCFQGNPRSSVSCPGNTAILIRCRHPIDTKLRTWMWNAQSNARIGRENRDGYMLHRIRTRTPVHERIQIQKAATETLLYQWQTLYSSLSSAHKVAAGKSGSSRYTASLN